MRDLIKNAVMEMSINGKVYKKFSIVEEPYTIHKSEYSEHGVKRHMICRSDNRFAIKFREKIDFSDLGEKIIIQQSNPDGAIFRRITLEHPRWDSFVDNGGFDLIDCRYWKDEVEDPQYSYINKSVDEVNDLLR